MTQPISRRLVRGPSKIDPANGGHDQVAENKQHAGNANEAGHDEPEKRVKQKIPPAHAQLILPLEEIDLGAARTSDYGGQLYRQFSLAQNEGDNHNVRL